MTGIVYVKVKLMLEMDIDENQVDTLVENLDYNFRGGVYEEDLIAETEIVEHGTNYNLT